MVHPLLLVTDISFAVKLNLVKQCFGSSKEMATIVSFKSNRMNHIGIPLRYNSSQLESCTVALELVENWSLRSDHSQS